MFLLISAAFVVVALAAGAVFLRTRPAAQKKGGGGGAAVIRTAVVVAGDLHRTVRLSGTISAERFAAIMAPQLHGSHSGRGRDGGSSPSMRVTTVAVTSMGSSGVSSATNSTSASSIVSTISGAAVSSGGTDAAAAGGSSGSSRGARVSNNRSAVTSSARAGRSSSGGSSRSSSPVGDADLGSTSGSLMRGGGGGGPRGGSDFTLVLLEVAKPGSFVKKGEVVAEFDRQYQLLRLDDYKASVTQHESNIKKLQADLAVARQAHDQLLLVAKADLDKANLDMKTTEVRSAIDSERLRLFAEEAQARYKQILTEVNDFNEGQKAQLRALQIDHNQSKIELQRATNNVDRMLMKAPIDGIVVMQSLHRHGGEQAQIQKGDQVYSGMFFMSIVDPSSMVVNASVNQADSELLRLGQKARVRLDAYPDLELPATVIGIGAMTKPGGFRASYVREIPVRLKLDRMDPRVIPDLSASADVVISSESNAVLAPREAVFRAGGDSPFVFVKQGNGWVRRQVDLGLENHIMVAVRSGLRKGDVLAIERPQT